MNIYRFVVFFYLLLISDYSHCRINFIHLPKCGGTTIHSVLEKYFSVDEIYECRRLPKSRTGVMPSNSSEFLDSTPDFDGKLLVSGHIPYWFIKAKDKNINSSINIATIREPISRYLSNIRFLRRTSPNATIYESPENFMCMHLCSDPNLKGEELLNDCINTLNSLDYIIFMDEMQDDLRSLLEALDFELFDTEIPCINKNHIDCISVDDGDMKVVYERNSLDIELYKYAVKNLKNKNMDNLKKKKQNCPSLKKLLRKRSAIQYTFDLPLPGSGWSIRENVETGLPIDVWARGTDGRIFFNLDPSFDYIMQFQAHKLTDDISLAVKINGHPIKPRRLRKGYFSLYQVSISKDNISNNGLTEIHFESSHSYFYRDVYSNSHDERSLSIKLNLIQIFRKYNKNALIK